MRNASVLPAVVEQVHHRAEQRHAPASTPADDARGAQAEPDGARHKRALCNIGEVALCLEPLSKTRPCV